MNRLDLADWVHRFNASRSGRPHRQLDGGSQPRLSAEQLAQFAQIVGPALIVHVDGVVRWRIDLKRVIAGEGSGVEFHPLCRNFCCRSSHSHISAQPRHPAQDERIVEAFKNFLTRLRLISTDCRTTPVEIWFEDRPVSPEERPCPATGATRNAAKGNVDQRYDNAYLFGAIAWPAASGRPLALPYADRRHDAAPPRRNLSLAPPRALTLFCSSTAPDGTPRASSTCPTTLRRSSCPSPRPGAEPGRKRLAVSPPELARQTPSLKTTTRSSTPHALAWRKLIAQPETIHLHRNAGLGPRRSSPAMTAMV